MQLEKTTIFISYSLAIATATIYCFTIGFLDFFQVIETPSILSAIVFFFNVSMEASLSVFSSFNNLEIEPIVLIVSLINLGFSLITVFRLDFNEIIKMAPPRVADYIRLIPQGIYKYVITFFIFIVLMYLSHFSLIIIPVIVCPFILVFFSAHYFESISKLEIIQSKVQLFVNPRFVCIIILSFFVWFAPYQVGYVVASYIEPYKSFPVAWNNGPYKTNDLLVWKEDDRGFWINCKENIIYGINNEGRIFYSRYLPVFDKIVCK